MERRSQTLDREFENVVTVKYNTIKTKYEELEKETEDELPTKKIKKEESDEKKKKRVYEEKKKSLIEAIKDFKAYIDTSRSRTHITKKIGNFKDAFQRIRNHVYEIEKDLESKENLKKNEILSGTFRNPPIVTPEEMKSFVGENDKLEGLPIIPKKIKLKDIYGSEDTKSLFETQFSFGIKFPLLFPGGKKTFLLYGMPGVGKTLFVRAISGEFEDYTVYSAPIGYLLSTFTSGTASNIRTAFKVSEPSETKKTMLFFDEIDVLASKRKKGGDDEESKKENLTTLLQEIDGVTEAKTERIIIAATNFPWNLDDAILRRFTNKIFVDVPKSDEIIKIFMFIIRGYYKKLIRKDFERFGWTEEDYDTIVNLFIDTYFEAILKEILKNLDFGLLDEFRSSFPKNLKKFDNIKKIVSPSEIESLFENSLRAAFFDTINDNNVTCNDNDFEINPLFRYQLKFEVGKNFRYIWIFSDAQIENIEFDMQENIDIRRSQINNIKDFLSEEHTILFFPKNIADFIQKEINSFQYAFDMENYKKMFAYSVN